MWKCALFVFYRPEPKYPSDINRKDEGLHMTKKVGIIMGSASDLPVVKKATDVLKEFGVP